MAALSRPCLRSSSRKIVSVQEVPPTAIQQNSMPSTRRGKRARDSSPGSQSNAPTKKHKAQVDGPPRPRAIPRNEVFKSLPIRDKAGTKDAVTQFGKSRKLDLPTQQSPNGSITTVRNDRALGKNSNLIIDTGNALTQAEKRSLRSHDGGSRSKSELALYFPNYDELVSIEPKEPEFLTPETCLYVTDEPSQPATKNPPLSAALEDIPNKLQRLSPHAPTINGFSKAFVISEETFRNLHNARRIDLASSDKSSRHSKDPLTDAVYLKAHRRAERQEKQLRNIEKERAMHEKVQLERLLDGLKGHDWLRIMGISGITDGEKKAFEPKRNYFIEEVRALLVKFREWKEEEKRRKVEKEESMQDEEEEQDQEQEQEGSDGGESDGDPPDYTDVDASAARQLHQEAILATNGQSGKVRLHRKKEPIAAIVEKPFTSFYKKPYLRDAAIGKHRRGRVQYAFGQPLPDPDDQDFGLPVDILSPERVAASARKQRISKRQSKGS